ncbi:hypothetical protein DUI87_18735 [Hirundo rustica rustica]|uniref:Reverse transcriptase domain-containing protein n=1 Tax=Hirundo rustica rustica TaxID=333673 RepID=A0A3M0JXB6_HIRRU|nr:hypothetical protein DUI87_18735 [Hirundo rustica rustica]
MAQVPLQNRYEALDLESQPDDLDDLEGNYLPSEPPNYDSSVRWISTSNIKKKRRAGSDEIEKRNVKVIKRYFRALGQVVDKTGAQVVFCSVPLVAEKNDERNRRTHIINKWLNGDFNLPDICWELNIAEKRQSRKFLECMEDNFLLQLVAKKPLFVLKMATSVKDNEKCFYKYIDGKRKGKANLCSLLDEGGNLVSADEEKAEVLNAFFASVFSGKTTCLQENCSLGLVDGVREQNGPLIIQENAVRELLRCLDIHKSMGPDGVHPRVMRELADELGKPLSVIYQQSWLTGEVPDDWKLANVTPIHKKGGREDPNYRPVSLNSIPAKIM